MTDRVYSEVFDPKEQGGLLKIDVERYMDCLNVDLVELDKLLVEEIETKKWELESAEKEANRTITEMQ